MTIDIRMPKLSDQMEEGTVIRWIVSAGQTVAQGDPIAEVETDKANVEIEAEQAGVVDEIVVQEGGAVAVGAVIARLSEGAEVQKPATRDAEVKQPDAPRGETRERSEAGETRPDPEPSAGEREPGPRTRVAQPGPKSESRAAPLASPVARDLAEARGVDLSTLKGSGPGGRIVKRDVEEATGGNEHAPPRSGDESVQPTQPASAPPSRAADGEGMSRMRRTIAARMEKAKREIPHFYVRSEIDLSEAMRVYEVIRAEEVLPGLTVTHILLRALARTLPRHPRINALWVDDSIQLVDDINIGIAVALDDGLLVPVIKRAQTLSLRELVVQARALTERARANKPQADDLVGASISVSNIGMLDVDELTPIINAPQAAILGVGAVRERPVVRAGALTVGRTAMFTLACDHRVVNGIEAGRFFEELKRALESPLALVLEAE